MECGQPRADDPYLDLHLTRQHELRAVAIQAPAGSLALGLLRLSAGPDDTQLRDCALADGSGGANGELGGLRQRTVALRRALHEAEAEMDVQERRV